jgi:hypothetical protein
MYQGQSFTIAAVMPEAIQAGLFVSLCTVQEPDGLQTADGSPSGNWLNISGLVDIPCMDGPEADNRIRAKLEKNPRYIEGFVFRHVLLAGYYPAIEENDNWRAIVDGVAYDPLGVESDSQGTQTRLLLQLASV